MLPYNGIRNALVQINSHGINCPWFSAPLSAKARNSLHFYPNLSTWPAGVVQRAGGAGIFSPFSMVSGFQGVRASPASSRHHAGFPRGRFQIGTLVESRDNWWYPAVTEPPLQHRAALWGAVMRRSSPSQSGSAATREVPELRGVSHS